MQNLPAKSARVVAALDWRKKSHDHETVAHLVCSVTFTRFGAGADKFSEVGLLVEQLGSRHRGESASRGSLANPRAGRLTRAGNRNVKGGTRESRRSAVGWQ